MTFNMNTSVSSENDLKTNVEPEEQDINGF
jgi:hypothetical protein